MNSDPESRQQPVFNSRALREQVVAASAFLKAISNPTRLLVICALAEGEHSVGELHAMVDLSQSSLSQHLMVLRREGLVHTRRDAQTIYYSLTGNDVQALMACLHGIFCS